MSKYKNIQNKNMIKHNINYNLIPIILIAAILPLITRLKMVAVNYSTYAWFPNISQKGDFFLYYKSRFLIAISITMVVFLIDQAFIQRKNMKVDNTFIALGIYAMFVVISSVMSDDLKTAVWGGFEQQEGMLVLLGYCIICFYTYNNINNEKDIKVIFLSLLFSAVIMGIIGIGQNLGIDIINSDFVKALIIPADLKQYSDSVIFNFGNEEYNKVYMTLYNPNYVGTYVVLVINVFICMTIISTKKVIKVLSLITSAILLICLIGSGSKGGIIALAVSWGIGLSLLRLFRVKNDKFLNKKANKNIILSLALIFVLLLVVSGVGGNIAYSINTHKSEYLLKDIVVNDDSVDIAYGYEIINLSYKENKESLEPVVRINNEGVMLEYSETDDLYSMAALGNNELKFGAYKKDEINYVYFIYNEINFKFTDYTDDGKYTYITINGKQDTIKNAISVLNGYEKIFTYRGYIWGRALPMIKNHILFGSGPDTFISHFPQNDYVMRANMGYGFFTEILIKPHNMYIQAAIQTGLLSLICIMAFVCAYIYLFIIKIIKSQKYSLIHYIGITIFVSIIGYIIVGMINDSMVVTAPLFWMMLGCGFSVNKLIN